MKSAGLSATTTNRSAHLLTSFDRFLNAILQTVLFIVCAGNELFYVALYLMKWVHVPLWQSLELEQNWITNSTWAEALALVCGPICAYKNFINLVQLWKAAKILVGVDLAERAKAREEEELREKKN